MTAKFWQLLAATALLCAAGQSALALDPNLPPGRNFDLTHWKLTLPDASVTEIPAAQVAAGYTNASWFYTGTDGAMVFWCPVNGGTTSGSSYPRSELREQISPPDDNINWTGAGTHILSAQCKVTQLPSTGKVIIGQIHGKSGNAYPLIKLNYASGSLKALVKESPNSDTDTTFNLPSVALNTLFSYEIKLVDGLLSVTVNSTTISVNIFQTDPAWTNQTLYFKAGSYCQDNSGPSTEGARVAFYQLTVTHSNMPSTPPVLSSQPPSQAVYAGATVVMSVSATGAPPLSYQWWRTGSALTNSANISGAQSNTLVLSNVLAEQTGTYWLVVSNAAGATTSSTAVLTVLPVILLPEALDTPGWLWTTGGSAGWVGQASISHDGVDAAQSGAVADNQAAWLQATVTGPGTLSFWWKVSSETNNDQLRFSLNGLEQWHISGEVDWQWLSYDLGSGSQTLQWSYSKNGSASGGQDRAWLDQVQFAPMAPPVIANQPVSQSVAAGTTVSFSVVAGGDPPLSYQWWGNGSALANGLGISGVQAATLVLSNALPAQAGTYWVVVSNGAGAVTSSNAILTVLAPPVITNQPISQSVVAGTTVNFSVIAGGSPPLSYQWWGNGSALVNGSSISGAQSPTLVLSNVLPAQAGTYWVVVDNGTGAVASSNAILTVALPVIAVSIAPSLSPDAAVLSWAAAGGINYRVCYKTNLADATWTEVAIPVTITGSTATATDAMAGPGQRFYRILEY